MKTHEHQVSFRLPEDVMAQMYAIKRDIGIPLSEQLRRGLEMWLAKQHTGGAPKKKAGRK